MMSIFKRKTKPTEVVCYPDTHVLRIWVIGDTEPFKYNLRGDNQRVFASEFLEWFRGKEGASYTLYSDTSVETVFARSGISAVRLETEEK